MVAAMLLRSARSKAASVSVGLHWKGARPRDDMNDLFRIVTLSQPQVHSGVKKRLRGVM